MTPQNAGNSPLGPSLRPPPPPPPPPPPSSSRLQRSLFRSTAFDHVEDVNMCRPGGHHPINLNDVIRQKFKIIHKLGNGGFALVWLARDLEENRNVAFKVLRADASDHEVKVLKHLKNSVARAQITNLYETFTICGPNGVHQCLVLDIGGPSLSHLSMYCKRPPLPFQKVASQNLAEGLAALHSAGICHGDLTDSNVLFEIKGLRDWTADEIYRYLEPPRTTPLLLLDGTPAPVFAPTNVVEALNYSRLDIEQLSGNVLITDLGEAFFGNNVPEGLGTPVSFSSPEMQFGYPPSYAVDLWALGCLIFEIYTFRVLIPTAFGSHEEALAMATETIGALPEEWQESYCDKERLLANIEGKHRWFDDQIKRERTLDSQICKHVPELLQDQHTTFIQLLESVLVFQPSRRLAAAEIGKHAWFMHE